jgi:hypothetical protein
LVKNANNIDEKINLLEEIKSDLKDSLFKEKNR